MPVPCLFPCELCGEQDVCLLLEEVKNRALRKKICSQQICLSGCDTCEYRACVRCKKNKKGGKANA